LLESELSKEYKDSENLLLGELQFSFVAFLVCAAYRNMYLLEAHTQCIFIHGYK